MGAHSFSTFVPDNPTIKNAQEAFAFAREEALDQYGNNGYTGTIAEKSGYKILPHGPLKMEKAVKLMDHMFENDDSRVDRYSPAACLRIDDGDKQGWLFFGYARS